MVEFINPPSMFSNPAYSQAVIIPAGARMMLIGGQNAVAQDGSIVGVGDLAAQSRKAIENLIACLDAAGGDITSLVQVTLAFKGEIDIMPGYMEWAKVWGKRSNAPTVNAAKVLGLARPDLLIEISGIAVLP
ncbi:MAG: RidA family protein [Hyphomicrobiales bacterium]|nr:MAG: RidA family protein [Hyphomicrobiales bacterium]